jgi:lipoprotein-anchoring transpeptidase ErfK/SrfK
VQREALLVRLGEIPVPAGGAPATDTPVILVSIGQQWLWVYDHRQLVYATEVTTAMPGLATPLGTFQVESKAADTWFTSPWPIGSPYYYTPEHVNYALLFRWGGFYIHDAPWRQSFGPGSDLPHTTPDGRAETGSHGCVDVPTAAGAWLYAWARVGTTISIVA